jgi:predicted Zn-dependent protease with MMP-like domain
VTRSEFEQCVEDAFLEVPKRLRDRIENVAFLVDNHRRPGAGERAIRSHGTLLGLYHGIPLTRRAGGYSGVLPDTITLFQDAIEAYAGPDPDAIRRQIFATVHHELAHYFGFSETEVRRWERKRHQRPGFEVDAGRAG